MPCPRCGGVIPGEAVHHAFPHLLPICECRQEVQEEHRKKMRRRKEKRKKNPHAVALGKLGGAIGGHARAKSLSKEQLTVIARNAAAARWLKKAVVLDPPEPIK